MRSRSSPAPPAAAWLMVKVASPVLQRRPPESAGRSQHQSWRRGALRQTPEVRERPRQQASLGQEARSRGRRRSRGSRRSRSSRRPRGRRRSRVGQAASCSGRPVAPRPSRTGCRTGNLPRPALPRERGRRSPPGRDGAPRIAGAIRGGGGRPGRGPGRPAGRVLVRRPPPGFWPAARSSRSIRSSSAAGLWSRSGADRRTSVTSSVVRGSGASRMSTKACPMASIARTIAAGPS